MRRVPLVRKIRGGYLAHGRRFAIVVSRFNEFLTQRLLEGALEVLFEHGARKKDVAVAHVPGAFEMPLVIRKWLRSGGWDAVIALAVVIRGKTRHFDQVVRETARSIRDLSDRSEVPVILGMISANSDLEAIRRVGLKGMNKGREWALAAIEMANLMKKLTPRRIRGT